MDKHYLILGGDMNCALSIALDCSSPKSVVISKAALAIQLFLNTNGISAAWCFQNPTSRGYFLFSPVYGTYS